MKQSSADQENALWKYFGMRLTAHPPEAKPGEDNRLDVLLSEVAALRKDVKASKSTTLPAATLLPSMPLGGSSAHLGLSTTPVGLGFGALGRIDYLPPIASGIWPDIFWVTTSGASVGAIMAELYSQATQSGLAIRNIHFDAGLITIVVDANDLNHEILPSLQSIAASHSLHLAIEAA